MFREGRAPEFVGPPSACLQAHLRALAALRDGDMDGVRTHLADAEAARRPVTGRLGDAAFDDLRDLDDLTGGVLEVIAASGMYYWIDLDTVVEISFHAPERPRDLIWRRASIDVRDGPEGEVFVPALYVPPPGSQPRADHLLGRVTEWIGDDDTGPVLGLGQRCWLVGDRDMPLMDLSDLTFDAPRPAHPEDAASADGGDADGGGAGA